MNSSIKSRFKFRFRDVMIPETWNYYGFGIGAQKCLLTYQWMVKSALAKPEYLVDSCALDLLAAQPTCRCSSGYYEEGLALTKDWQRQLERRFHYVLFSSMAGPGAQRWLADTKIGLETVMWINLPWVAEGDWWDKEGHRSLLDRCLAGDQKKLVWQLNSYHADATELNCVKLRFNTAARTGQAQVVLDYGVDHSSWHHVLATQEGGEPLFIMLARALRQLRALQGGEPEEPLEPREGYRLIRVPKAEWVRFCGTTLLAQDQIVRQSFGRDDWWGLVTE